MAENSILALPAAINDCEILIDGEIYGQPAILSTKIADRFNKHHQHVLRDIDTLMSILPPSFTSRNFKLTHFDVTIANGAIRKARAYLLTRDAFSLLVMGMTGKAAVIWKLRYIEAFNALEKAALENKAALAREAGYAQGHDEALALPVVEAERRKAYLEGMKEGQKFRAAKDGLAILKKICAYKKRGLNYAEIGKILDMSRQAVESRVRRARESGFLPKAGKSVQASLPGVM